MSSEPTSPRLTVALCSLALAALLLGCSDPQIVCGRGPALTRISHETSGSSDLAAPRGAERHTANAADGGWHWRLDCFLPGFEALHVLQVVPHEPTIGSLAREGRPPAR